MKKSLENPYQQLERISLAAQNNARLAITEHPAPAMGRPLSALICLCASYQLKEKEIEHTLHGGSSFWRVSSDTTGVITATYDKNSPTDMSAWICMGDLIYDPSFGAVVDERAQQGEEGLDLWRPDFLMLHREDMSSYHDVFRKETGSVHYLEDEHATASLLAAKASIINKRTSATSGAMLSFPQFLMDYLQSHGHTSKKRDFVFI